MTTKSLLLVCLLSSVVFAQQPQATTAPVPLTRTPAPPQPQSRPVPTPNQYPISQAINILQGETPEKLPPISISPPPPNGLPVPNPSHHVDVPADYQPPKDVALGPTGADAVRVSTQWQEGHNLPTPGSDGRVLYTYGAGLPVLVCSPLHVCVLELQPGEKLVGEPHVGDSVRWEVSPAQAGSGSGAVPMIVVKPRLAGLDTTMVVPTDRRAYYLRLESKADEYIARVAFSYPDDGNQQWHEYMEKQRAQEERVRLAAASQHIEDLPNTAIENMYWNYEVKGGDATVRPVRVMDDGAKTYIQMPLETAHRELPVLVVRGPAGSEMVNFRVKDNMYIVDRLFDRGALLLGSGKHQVKVEILRKQSVSMKKSAPASSAQRGGL